MDATKRTVDLMIKITLICGFMFMLIPVFDGDVYSACFRNKHIFGTSGNTKICQEQYNLTLQKQRDEVADRREKYEEARAERRKQENSGNQSGNTGTIVNLGKALTGNTDAEEAAMATGIALTRHNIGIEWGGYFFPGAYQFDRQMKQPVLMPSGVRYEWYMSKNFGLGVIYQQYELSHTKSFDPIVETRTITETVTVLDEDGNETEASREIEREVPLRWPGAIDSITYQRLLYFATFNAALGEYSQWNIAIRFGSGMAKAEIKYNDIDMSTDENKYGEAPRDREISASRPWVFDFAVQRWFEGTRVGAYVRFIEAANDTNTYLDYIDVGGMEVGITAMFSIPSFGYL